MKWFKPLQELTDIRFFSRNRRELKSQSDRFCVAETYTMTRSILLDEKSLTFHCTRYAFSELLANDKSSNFCWEVFQITWF